MNDYKISTSEAVAIMTNLLCNKIFVLAPYYLQKCSSNAILITISLYFTIALIIFNICIRLYHDKYNLFDATKIRILRQIIGVIIFSSLSIVITLTLRQYAEGIKILTFQKSSVSFLCGIIGVGMITGAYCGLKSISKSNRVFTPLIYIVATILTVLSVNKGSLYNIYPILGDGLNSFFKKGYIVLSMLFESILLFILPVFLEKPKEIKKIGNYSFLLSFLIYIIIGGAYYIMKPQNFNLESYEPFFNLIKEIEFGGFIQRFDLTFLIMYCLSGFLYLSTMLYFSTQIIGKTLAIGDKQSIIIPTGILIVLISFANGFQEYMFTLVGKANYFLWIIAFVMPFTPLLKFRRIK